MNDMTQVTLDQVAAAKKIVNRARSAEEKALISGNHIAIVAANAKLNAAVTEWQRLAQAWERANNGSSVAWSV